jgi:hypothetical protein
MATLEALWKGLLGRTPATLDRSARTKKEGVAALMQLPL